MRETKTKFRTAFLLLAATALFAGCFDDGLFSEGTLSGTVTGADSVIVTLSGDSTATQGVNSGGTDSFLVMAGGTYPVTVSKPGWGFSSKSRVFVAATENGSPEYLS